MSSNNFLTNHRNYSKGKLIYKGFKAKDMIQEEGPDAGKTIKYKIINFAYKHPMGNGKLEEGKPQFEICRVKHPTGMKLDKNRLVSFSVFELYDGLCIECIQRKEDKVDPIENCKECEELREDIRKCIDVKERLSQEGYVSLWEQSGFINFNKSKAKINQEVGEATTVEILEPCNLHLEPSEDSKVLDVIPTGTTLVVHNKKNKTFLGVKYSQYEPTFEVTFVNGRTVLKTISNTNMYSSNNVDSDVLNVIPPGEEIIPLEVSNDVYKIRYGGSDGFYRKLLWDICTEMCENRTALDLPPDIDPAHLFAKISQPIYFQKDQNGKFSTAKNPSSFMSISYYKNDEKKQFIFAQYDVPGQERLSLDMMMNASITGKPTVTLTGAFWNGKVLSPKLYVQGSVVSSLNKKEEFTRKSLQTDELRKANENRENVERIRNRVKELETTISELKREGLLERKISNPEPEAVVEEPKNPKSMLDLVSGGPTMTSTDIPGMDFNLDLE